jgi:hypothetical protein
VKLFCGHTRHTIGMSKKARDGNESKEKKSQSFSIWGHCSLLMRSERSLKEGHYFITYCSIVNLETSAEKS